MRHDSQYPLRQAHYVSHSTDFANRAIGKHREVYILSEPNLFYRFALTRPD